MEYGRKRLTFVKIMVESQTKRNFFVNQCEFLRFASRFHRISERGNASKMISSWINKSQIIIFHFYFFVAVEAMTDLFDSPRNQNFQLCFNFIEKSSYLRLHNTFMDHSVYLLMQNRPKRNLAFFANFFIEKGFLRMKFPLDIEIWMIFLP